jgi:hypothetical protein
MSSSLPPAADTAAATAPCATLPSVPTPLERYLEVYDDQDGAVFVQLDAAIRTAAPELESAIRYRLLGYTVDRDWRHRPPAGSRRELASGGEQGGPLLLDDPLGVLRPGSSTLMTWDMPRGADIDSDAVGRSVREALEKREHFLANADVSSADARARYGKG